MTAPARPDRSPPGRGTPRLRVMTEADLPGVLILEDDLFGEEAWSGEMLAGELAQQPASRHYLVADDHGVIAGYGGLLAAGTQADVVTLAVARDQWGQGTGAALLTALLDEAARRGAVEVFLEVRTDNDRAQALYRRFGFGPIGVRRGYYQPSNTDALVMRKDLSATGTSSTGTSSTGTSSTGTGSTGTSSTGTGRGTGASA